MTEACLARLRADEGLRLFPYLDTVGKLTIGYGRNLTDNGITQPEAEAMLEHDALLAEHWCRASFPWFDGLNEARQIVLVSMMFNLGRAKLLAFTEMIAALKVGNYQAAALAMLDSRWAQQVKDRAVRLAQMMQEGEI